MIALISAMPRGSRPDVGSSSITMSGSPSSACPMAILWRMPFENVDILLSAHPDILTFSRTSSVWTEIDSGDMPMMPPM